MESPEPSWLRGISRLLDYRLSITVAKLLETGLWLGLVYVIIGVVCLFLRPDGVQLLQTRAQEQFGIPPSSIYEVATVAGVLLWPLMMLLPGTACGDG
ncbi:hypothetical protein AWC02_19195 [Mycolicibacter engbaekii]|uniref:Uncharacterized protein n=1 Tax=Mycolicibacter engbaekii TaxID=188915 RepID=A0A1X1T6D9_9MYCO|nr:hypothetical protein [Mycolicibacter engbaekii]ORV40144.1 hypothetical protein AWC02_19195 [Mycolicibacter engbaekii]